MIPSSVRSPALLPGGGHSLSTTLREEPIGSPRAPFPLKAPSHPSLRFERISKEATIRDFAELNCVSYGVPVETSLSLVKEHTPWSDHAYGFVAYQGEAVPVIALDVNLPQIMGPLELAKWRPTHVVTTVLSMGCG